MKYITRGIYRALWGLAIAGAISAGAADQDYVELWTFDKQVSVIFTADSAQVLNNAGAGVTWAASGTGIVITSAVAGVEYVLSGTSTNSFLKIVGAEAAKLTLNGVDLACTNGPAITVQSTNRCFVVLAEGAANTLTDSTVYTQTGDGTLYSTGPLLFSGLGKLAVTGKKKNGIHSSRYVRILGGEIAVPVAPKDGLHSVQFRMDNGTFATAATGDGIDADTGTVEINGGSITTQSKADDVKGIKCDGAMTINGGAINMTVGGVQSKGLKSGGGMTVNGGTMVFNLTGAMYLSSVTVSNQARIDPSYCTAIKGDTNITFNGGSITITHSGTAGKGVSADGSISIRGGTFDIVTTGGCSSIFTNVDGALDVAASDCLKADMTLEILGGTINAVSTGNAGDCLSADGAGVIGTAGISDTPVINVATRGSKVLVSGSGNNADYSNPKAFKAVGNLVVNGGIFRATTKNDGGEGLESKANLTINGGLLEITAYDDCINAASSITINGGTIYCYSLGNDAIDSNGTLRITGGTIVSSGTTAPEEGFDCDQNNFTITGGILVGTGGATSSPTASTSTQRSVIYKATSAPASGTIIQVKSATGNNLVYRVPRSYSGGGGGPGGGGGMTMLFSNSGLASGTTYSIVTGATVTGGTEFHGLYTGATVTGGSTVKTFNPTTMVTTVQ